MSTVRIQIDDENLQAPFVWSATGLPPGLSIRTANPQVTPFYTSGDGEIWGIVSDVSVNYVNAGIIAKEKGLKVVESKVSEHKDFASLLTINLKNGADARSARMDRPAASVFRHPRT